MVWDIFKSLALVVDVLRNIVIRCNCRATIVFVLSATNSDLLSVLIVDEMFFFDYFPFFCVQVCSRKMKNKKKHDSLVGILLFDGLMCTYIYTTSIL